jgi:hypothetical protein
MSVTQRATHARRLVTRLGLLPLAFVAYRTVREATPAKWRRNRQLRRQSKGKLPIPPGNLIFSSTGTRDVEWFLRTSGETAGAIRGALASVDRPLESMSAVLELGCGCGRVLRQWADVTGPRFFGSDYNPSVVSWVQRNLPHVTAGVNQLSPPLSYADG